MKLSRGVVAAGAVVLVIAATLAALALGSDDLLDAGSPPEVTADASALRGLGLAGALVVRAVDPRAPRADGQLYEISPDGTPRRVSRLWCKRVAVSPAGAGVCLRVSRNGVDYEGIVFGRGYERRHRFGVRGVPDRARVSPDGRYAAYTSFDAAQSQGYFETAEDFHTYTRIVDMETGEELAKLERLHFAGPGAAAVRAAREIEVWGVTFARGGSYYATVQAGRRHFLVRGRVGRSTARVVTDRVECPALSPDRARIAYKRRLAGTNLWRLHVMSLETGRSIPLAEELSVDDQPTWLGDRWVAYSDDHAVLATRADGSGAPIQLASNATSPVPLGRPAIN